MRNNIFVIIRLVLGVLFIISGLEKALGPTENFLYVIQGYEILPDALARLAAVGFPWIELIVGVFILLGLWLDVALKALALISVFLIGMVGQAIARNLPLDNCGCFGSLIHLPLRGVILVDVTVLICTIICLKNIARSSRFSLDGLYVKK
ncbi:MAG: DoxX family membrane protein [Candidatus Omnitrophica bacterium]|nr:DoxX family membrane protein [Candidatus Omnitrophota bacterium]